MIADRVTGGDGGTPLASVLGVSSRDRGHGRVELRRLQVTNVAGLDFPTPPRRSAAPAGSARPAAAPGARSPWTRSPACPSTSKPCSAGRLSSRALGGQDQLH
jgi:hypothetical protein